MPILISTRMYKDYEDQGEDTEVIVVQQNCDPWNEQFDEKYYDQVIQNNINLSLPLVTPKTRFIVSSESAIQEGIWLHELDQVRALKTLHEYMQRFPQAAFRHRRNHLRMGAKRHGRRFSGTTNRQHATTIITATTRHCSSTASMCSTATSRSLWWAWRPFRKCLVF